jgi:hypothetical protein
MPKIIRQHLFANAVKTISRCIEHLHDDELSPPEIRARELLAAYCELLVKRWDNPSYGRGVNDERA